MKWIILLVLLTGCTTYDIKRDAEGIVSVKVKSTRSFEAPNLNYRKTDEGVSFDFEAANADNNTDAILGTFQGMMGLMMEMMRQRTPQ